MNSSADSTSIQGEGHRFVALDAWRGIAALFVALFRLDADGHLHRLPFIHNAWLFVDFFFVLSGFVIGYAYLDRLGTARTTRIFVIRRVGRVWPLHMVLLAVFVAIEAARAVLGVVRSSPESFFVENKAPITILFDTLLIQALGVTTPTYWNTPAWSISTEFWTYIVFALLCFGGRRVVAALGAVIVIAGLSVVGAFSPSAMDTTFEYGFPRCLAGFFAGVLACMLWQERLRDWSAGRVLGTALEVGSVALALIFVSYGGKGLASLAAPFVFAGLILVFAFQAGALSAALSGGVGRTLGDLSYSIYMTALLVSIPFNRIPVALAGKMGVDITHPHPDAAHAHTDFSLGPTLANDLYTLVYLAAVIAFSWLTWRFIETPGRAWFNARAK